MKVSFDNFDELLSKKRLERCILVNILFRHSPSELEK